MFAATLTITTSRQNRAEVLQALRTLAGPMQSQSGFAGLHLYCDAQDPAVLVWIEEWDTREALIDRVRSSDYLTVLAIMEMSAAPPLLRFDRISETAGLELVESARCGVRGGHAANTPPSSGR